MSTARTAWDFLQNAGQNGDGMVPRGIFLQKHARNTCFSPQLSLSLPVRHGSNKQDRRRVSIREFDCTQAHQKVSTCVVECVFYGWQLLRTQHLKLHEHIRSRGPAAAFKQCFFVQWTFFGLELACGTTIAPSRMSETWRQNVDEGGE